VWNPEPEGEKIKKGFRTLLQGKKTGQNIIEDNPKSTPLAGGIKIPVHNGGVRTRLSQPKTQTSSFKGASRCKVSGGTSRLKTSKN